jgi:hypothetical protein
VDDGKVQMTSVPLPSSLWKDDGDSRQKGQFDAVHHTQGFVNITGSSNSWPPTFQRNAPAK